MFLACDLGNTFAKFGIYDGNTLVSFLKCRYDEYSTDLFTGRNISRIAVSSVVPELTGKISTSLSETFGINPFILDSCSKLNIKINYLSPSSLGIDRICSMEGALSLFKSDPSFSNYSEKTFLVTVDLGTATTINIVRYYAEFTGGIIMPGLSTMARSLHLNTAKLPEIDLSRDYRSFWGNDTSSSIASGIINSTVSIIERSVSQLKTEFNADNVKLYITGGNSAIIENHLTIKAEVVMDLVLRGVKAIYERNFVE